MNIRLWKLGKLDGDNPNYWILPTKDSISKLKELLSNKDGSGVMDLVWGPDIECQVITEQDADKMLIPEKLDDGRVLFRLEDI